MINASEDERMIEGNAGITDKLANSVGGNASTKLASILTGCRRLSKNVYFHYKCRREDAVPLIRYTTRNPFEVCEDCHILSATK